MNEKQAELMLALLDRIAASLDSLVERGNNE